VWSLAWLMPRGVGRSQLGGMQFKFWRLIACKCDFQGIIACKGSAGSGYAARMDYCSQEEHGRAVLYKCTELPCLLNSFFYWHSVSVYTNSAAASIIMFVLLFPAGISHCRRVLLPSPTGPAACQCTPMLRPTCCRQNSATPTLQPAAGR